MVDARRLDASTWAGIGVLGLLVFAIGVGIPYLPSARHLPYRSILPIGIAVLGGAIAALGLGFAYDLREGAPRVRRPPAAGVPTDTGSIRSAPSFEIYDPHDPPTPGRPKP